MEGRSLASSVAAARLERTAQRSHRGSPSSRAAAPPTSNPTEAALAEEPSAQAEAAEQQPAHNGAEAVVCEPPTDEETAAGEEGAASLPARLKLGLTVDTMEWLLRSLPADAVAQCNKAIPLKDGAPKFPTNAEEELVDVVVGRRTLNGYVNQFFLGLECAADGLSACERLLQRGAPGVGEADVFVSWALQTSLATLIDALREYLKHHPELAADTKFWVCDFVIRQGAAAKADVARLGECVRAIGHTVLLMEPWDEPQPLTRAYCILEVYHTQASGAMFEVVMSKKQQAAFERALERDYASIATKLSKVDVRNAVRSPAPAAAASPPPRHCRAAAAHRCAATRRRRLRSSARSSAMSGSLRAIVWSLSCCTAR